MGLSDLYPGPCPLCRCCEAAFTCALAFSPLQEVQKGLQDRGHNQTTRPFFLNVVQAVSQDGACVYAATDPRKGGEASGY